LAFANNLATLLLCVGVLGGSVIAANVSTQVLAQTSVPAEALPRVQANASVVAAITSSAAIFVLAAGFDHHAGPATLLGVAAWYLVLVPLGIQVTRAFHRHTATGEGIPDAGR
jgi:hypothetical protein